MKGLHLILKHIILMESKVQLQFLNGVAHEQLWHLHDNHSNLCGID